MCTGERIEAEDQLDALTEYGRIRDARPKKT